MTPSEKRTVFGRSTAKAQNRAVTEALSPTGGPNNGGGLTAGALVAFAFTFTTTGELGAIAITLAVVFTASVGVMGSDTNRTRLVKVYSDSIRAEGGCGPP